MKCKQCEVQVQEHDRYCWHCGAIVEHKQPCACKFCHLPLKENAKFCPHCGAENPVERQSYAKKAEAYEKLKSQKTVSEQYTQKLLARWKPLAITVKIAAILAALAIVLLIAGFVFGKSLVVIGAILQGAFASVVILMHRNIIRSATTALQHAALVISALFMVMSIGSLLWKTVKLPEPEPSSTTEETLPEPTIETIRVPYSAQVCKQKSFETVEKDFRDAGFTDITLECSEDLSYDEANLDGIVSEIVVAGISNFSDEQALGLNSAVVIRYRKVAQCALQLHVDFAKNLLFNTYDLELFVDGELVETLPHGRNADFTLKLYPGNHEILFAKSGSDTINGSVIIPVLHDTIADCKVSCAFVWVSVDAEYAEIEPTETDSE